MKIRTLTYWVADSLTYGAKASLRAKKRSHLFDTLSFSGYVIQDDGTYLHEDDTRYAAPRKYSIGYEKILDIVDRCMQGLIEQQMHPDATAAYKWAMAEEAKAKKEKPNG